MKGKGIIIRVYDKRNAPQGAILLYERIETNGIIDLSPTTYNVLNYNQRIVYFYQLKDTNINKG